MELTDNILKAAIPDSTSVIRTKYLPFLKKYMTQYGIVSDKQVAAFLAQVGHESSRLSVVAENLNYSASRLLQVFPKYFTSATAAQYANNPQRIANRVYANRMGNGNEASGDGWKYRGQGLIQITGKTNYIACKNGTGIDCVTHPELLQQPEWAVKSACWYWNNAGLNKIAG